MSFLHMQDSMAAMSIGNQRPQTAPQKQEFRYTAKDAGSMKAVPNTAAMNERRGWSPYIVNGGTVMAVAGKDFCVIAGDTRMSYGYSIATRDSEKIYSLTNKCILGSAGMQAERKTLRKVLDYKTTFYRHQHQKDLQAEAVAQMLSNTLYHKRFFPYYTFNVLGGVDEYGVGAVWGYDAIGSFERMPYCVTGSGTELITSLLDNQVGFKTQMSNFKDLSIEETVDLVKDCFTCAGERDIYTGDFVDIAVITPEGSKFEKFELKLD